MAAAPGMAAFATAEMMTKMAKALIPKLGFEGGMKHKGDAGRIAIVGGSVEYTGAPYFAAMSAYRCGADLVHVFCPPQAAIVIKGYSPDLIVHPCKMNPNEANMVGNKILDLSQQSTDGIDNWDSEWLPRMTAIVLGPGLGRGTDATAAVIAAVSAAKTHNIPIIIDADALYVVSKNLNIIEGYPRAILTPNHHEYKRIEIALGFAGDGSSKVATVCRQLNGVTIIKKDFQDVICNSNVEVVCEKDGCPRRCGGQGDILAGSVAAFAAWSSKYGDGDFLIPACFGGALLTRHAAAAAFAKVNRSMATSDILSEVGASFQQLFAEV